MADKKASTRKSASKKTQHKEHSETYAPPSPDDGVGVALIETGRGVQEITYVTVDGMAMVEGDICLGSVEDVERQTANLRTQLNTPGLAAAALISGADKRWPDCQVPFQIASGVTNQARITDAIAHWEANTVFRFIERSTTNAAQFPDFVEFVAGSGCSSFVGKRGGRQTITMSTTCSTGNMIHEIGHAVGLWHEQSREDRDSFVTIMWANIQANRASNFNQHITDGDDVGPYDYGSIMHYPRTAFSINGQDTIVPTDSTADIGQRDGLSAGDIAAVNALCPPILAKLPKELSKEFAKELPKELKKELPKDIIKEFPKDGPKEFPKDFPKEFPKDISKDGPKDIIKDGPKDLPFEGPKRFPKDGPKSFKDDLGPKSLKDDLGPKSLAGDLGRPLPGTFKPGSFRPARPRIPFVLATGRDAAQDFASRGYGAQGYGAQGYGAQGYGAQGFDPHQAQAQAQATLDAYTHAMAQYEAYDALGLLGPHDRDEWQQLANEAQALAASLGLI